MSFNDTASTPQKHLSTGRGQGRGNIFYKWFGSPELSNKVARCYNKRKSVDEISDVI